MLIISYIFSVIGIISIIWAVCFIYKEVISPNIGINYLITYDLPDDTLAIAFPKPGLRALSYTELLILQDYIESRYGKAIPMNISKLGFCFTNLSNNEISRTLYYGKMEVKRMKREKKEKKKDVEPNKKGPTLYKI